MSTQNRIQLYEQIAAGLSSLYDQIRTSSLDSGLSGTSGEAAIVGWMRQWLPGRVSIRNGAVLSVRDDPTNQMDCLLFDYIESPIFHRIGQVDILPIEGILGAVEINYGSNTSYQKIGRDAEKLSKLAELAEARLSRIGIGLSHLPPDRDARLASVEQLVGNLSLHRGHDGKPILLIFAEQLSGDLQEITRRLMEYNKSVGVRRSIDGLFILQQGIALHIDPNQNGWITSRLPGAHLGCLSVSQGYVLLKMQSIILKHLYLSGKTHPEGFDAYVAQTGQGQKEITNARIVSGNEYIRQEDSGTVVIRG
jgi:hypothetical protein